MSREEPLISAQSAVYLARIINRIVASFDVARLSAEEAIEAHILLVRLYERVWRKHKHTLKSLYESLETRGRLWEDHDAEDDDSGNDNSSDGSH